MAELPAVAPEGPITRPIQSSLSSADIASPYAMLAANLKKTGAAADEVAESLATQAGAKAVTTDAQGNVQIDHPPIIGPAAKAFGDSVKIAALAQAEQAARRTDVTMRQTYLDKDDPQGYLVAADNFSKQMGAQYEKAGGPVLGLAVRKQIDAMTSATYKGLANEHERLQLHNQAVVFNTEIQHETNALFAMAEGGVTSGPEWDASWGKLNTIYDHIGSNPRMGVPAEKIAADKQSLNDELQVRGMQYHIVNETYGQGITDPAHPDQRETNPQVKYAAASAAAQTILTNKDLQLTPAQREGAYHRTMSALDDRVRKDQVMVNAIGTQADAVEKTATDGYPVNPDQIAQLKAAADVSGDPGVQARVARAEQISRYMESFRTLNPTQLQSTINELRIRGRQRICSRALRSC